MSEAPAPFEPYRPPASPVTESDNERPRGVTVACIAYLLLVAMTVVEAFVLALDDSGLGTMRVGDWLFFGGFGLMLFGVPWYLAFSGVGIGRYILAGAESIALVTEFMSLNAIDEPVLIPKLIYYPVALLCLSCLFSPSANAWYTGSRNMRDNPRSALNHDQH